MYITDYNDIVPCRPTKLDRSSMKESDWIKARTLELYEYLPQTSLEERAKYTDIRDEVITLNYKFFGYIASNKYINNNYITYEDKLQSALYHFCTMWHKFKYAAKYRTDLSFTVFFKLRVEECMERELNEVKYSLRRTLCSKVGEQLGKHWGQVKYEDLKHVNLSPEDMKSLQAMFGSMYCADLDTHALFISSEAPHVEIDRLYSDNYDSIEGLLIHEMVSSESKLDDSNLLELSTMLCIPFAELKSHLPAAEMLLHKKLTEGLAVSEQF